jgi:hypothetical protein
MYHFKLSKGSTIGAGKVARTKLKFFTPITGDSGKTRKQIWLASITPQLVL